MTREEQSAVWSEDRLRGTFSLNHFLYCYIHPANPAVLLVGVRLTAAVRGDGAIRYECPMLGAEWTADHYSLCDFRPDIRRALRDAVGLQHDERRECYKRCPYTLVLQKLNFITAHANDMRLDLCDAYWLPPVDVSWKREIRAH